jgi:autotransporter-associated beta strand protein
VTNAAADISNTLQLGGSGNGTFDVSAIGTQYRNFGSFNKVDTSVFALTGTSTFAGPVNVNGGTLAVNGNTTSFGSLSVNSGGTLGGNGTVGNTAIDGGVLAPGDPATGNLFGPLTVQGTLSFTAASTYMIQVSSTNAGRTNVTGIATLGGATVNAVFAPGGNLNRQYTILNATGGVSGIFNPLVNSNIANIQSTLSYDANDVFLDSKLVFVSPNGLNTNQQNVANALSGFFNSTGSIPAVFAALGPGGLTQASGEAATGTQQTTFNAMNQFMGLLTDPFIAGRGDGVLSSSGAPQFAEEADSASAYTADGKPRSKSERDAYAAIYRKAPVAEAFAQRWSVWAAGYGGSQTTDGNAALGSNTAASRVYGTAVGADYRFSPFTLAGFALAGGGTNFSVANGLGGGRSDLFQAGAFVRHSVGPAYISAALAYGWQDITTDRTVTIAGVDQLRAKFNANAWSGRVEGGYRFVTQGLGLTPYAAGQFTTFELPFYAETAVIGANTFALGYAAKSVTASRSEFGLRSDKSFAMQDAVLTLRGRAAWAHDFNPDRNIAATFQTLPGASFVVNGAAQSPDAALATASAEMKWLNGVSLVATFEGEFSGVTRSYAGKGIARYAW